MTIHNMQITTPRQYASVLLTLVSDYKSEEEFWESCSYHIDDSFAYWAFKSPVLANEALHQAHLQNPSIRQEAVKLIAEWKENYRNVVFNYPCQEFPQDLRERIEEVLNPIRDDIVVVFRLTYLNDHIARRNPDWREYPVAAVYAATQPSLEKALELLQGLGGEIDIIL